MSPERTVSARPPMKTTFERLEYCCADNEDRFIGEAFDRLGLSDAQRQLLLRSFRKASFLGLVDVNLRHHAGFGVLEDVAVHHPSSPIQRHHPHVDGFTSVQKDRVAKEWLVDRLPIFRDHLCLLYTSDAADDSALV